MTRTALFNMVADDAQMDLATAKVTGSLPHRQIPYPDVGEPGVKNAEDSRCQSSISVASRRRMA